MTDKRAQSRLVMRRLRARRRREGLCHGCGRVKTPKGTRCANCQAYNSQNKRDLMEAARA